MSKLKKNIYVAKFYNFLITNNIFHVQISIFNLFTQRADWKKYLCPGSFNLIFARFREYLFLQLLQPILCRRPCCRFRSLGKNLKNNSSRVEVYPSAWGRRGDFWCQHLHTARAACGVAALEATTSPSAPAWRYEF